MKRGYVHRVKHPSVANQRAALEEAGIDVIYTDWEDAVSALRKGDVLAIGGALHILANTANRIELAVERLQKAGCEVLDVTTGQITTGDGALMFGKAMRAIANETRFGDVKKAGAKGGKARAKSLHVKRAETRDDAMKIFWNTDLTWTQANAELKKLGWNMQSARRHMKVDGKLPLRRAGRPPLPGE